MTIERAIKAGCEASFTAVNPNEEFDGCDYPDCNCSGIGTAQAIIAALAEPTKAEVAVATDAALAEYDASYGDCPVHRNVMLRMQRAAIVAYYDMVLGEPK